LLLLVALCGVVAAWISDRHRLEARNRRLLTANRAQSDQIDRLKRRLDTRFSAVQAVYWWPSADEYIEMLKTAADEHAFLEKASSIAGADQAVVDDVVQAMIRLLDRADETTVERVLMSFQFIQEAAADKLAEHAPLITSSVVPLLASDSDRIVASSISTLQSFGPVAHEALPHLRKRMNDDSDYFAPVAATAISKIEPTAQIGSRLVDLIEMKHPYWYHAAFYLWRHVDVETAHRVLNDAYATAQNDEERDMATIALNQIPAKAEPADEREPE
jgi:hypothetical protein